MNTKHPLLTFFEMIKIEHTVFALPFAYTGAFLAGHGGISWLKFFLITLAMISARTAAMALNRLIDKKYDAINPRTANRALPKKLISEKIVWRLITVSLAVFLITSACLNRLCFFLSPIAILLLFSYSYLKRYTWLCHVGLGLVLACAPIGGWIAISGSLSATPIVLGAAMIFWLAGFDIMYACQDREFDLQFGLFSIPRTFGITRALWISAFFHVVTFVFFAWTGILAKLGWPYDLGLILIAVLLIYEHSIITPNDFSRINQAFFQANALISVIIFSSTLLSLKVWPSVF